MKKVLLGQIGRAHGIRGQVFVHTFTEDPSAIADYGALQDASGRLLALRVVRIAENGVVCAIDGICDRTAAEKLRGLELFVDRESLPSPAPGEYYRGDLVGLVVVDGASGERVGAVESVQNYGAGDLLEVRFDGRNWTELVPFRDPFVGAVDLLAGRVEIAPALLQDGGADPEAGGASQRSPQSRKR